MKFNLASIQCVLACILLSISIGCEKNNTEPDPIPEEEEKPSVTTSGSTTLDISYEGGTLDLQYNSNVDCEVSIPLQAQSWLSIITTKAMESHAVRISVAENDGEARNAVVTIKAKSGSQSVSYTVRQAANPAAGNNLDVSFDPSGLVIMDVNSSRQLSYTITSDIDDVTIEATPSSDLSATITKTDALHGTINVTTGASITDATKIEVVVSDGVNVVNKTIRFEATGLVVDGSNVKEVAYTGGSVELPFLTNVEFEVSIPTDAQSWLSLIATRAMESHSATLSAQPNKGEAREAVVTVRAKTSPLSITYTVRQAANPAAGNNLDVSFDPSGLVIMDVNSSRQIGYTITSGIDDVTIEATPSSDLSATITKTDALHGTINVTTGASITDATKIEVVVSDGVNVVNKTIRFEATGLVVDGSNVKEVAYTGGSVELPFLTNVEFEVSIPTDAQSWLSLIATRALESHSATLSAQPNKGEAREAVVTVRAKTSPLSITYTVRQAANENIIKQKNALMKFYEATNGDSWTNKTNWGTDKPLSEWYGVTVNSEGMVTSLILDSNNLSGSLTNEIGELSSLQTISLKSNKISGELPDSLGMITTLTSIDLSANEFTGAVPETFANLASLTNLNLSSNKLSGELTDVYTSMSSLTELHLSGNNFTGNNLGIFANMSNLNVLELYGNRLNGQIPESVVNCSKWTSWDPDNKIIPQQEGYALYYLNDKGLFVVPDDYCSTDFSKDGEVVELQKATQGTGINVIILGDGFTDIEVNNGQYEKVMRKAMENFFSVEPMTTFKDYFNVYTINTVSLNSFHSGDSTAFSCEYGNGTHVEGNYKKCWELANGKISNLYDSQTLIMVIINDSDQHGTTYTVSKYSTDLHEYHFKSTAFISIFNGLNDSYFEGIVHHEANGHGFGKLADEYFYPGMGEIPEEEIESLESWQRLGIFMNVDTTSVADSVHWSSFINDARYAKEKIGLYEGADVYETGIYRPTENSIMRNEYEAPLFNAPSRLEIYRRIIEYSGGTYSYDDFLTYDEINRKKYESSSVNRIPATTRVKIRHNDPPVMIRLDNK